MKNLLGSFDLMCVCPRLVRSLALLAFVPLLLPASLAAAKDPYAPRTDWSSFSEGKLNISGFIYRDMNRNGIYDLPDRPMEDIAVEMTDPNGGRLLRWTNSNGFANFSMSVHQDADITSPGDYSFDVLVPKGWSVTSGNKLQVKNFSLLPGSVADVVADPPFHAVGIVQDLSIAGQVAEATPDTVVTLTGPSGESRDAELSDDGRFSVAAVQGNWRVEVRDGESGESLERSVTVEHAPVQLSSLELGQDIPPRKESPRRVDFEEVTKKGIREMPNGVGDLMWWNFVALEVDISYTNNAVSGYYVAYNSSGHPARIYSDRPFDFDGGYFGVAWKRANGETLHLRGWRGEELVYEDQVALSNLGPVWFAADYRDITRLDLATEHYWQFVADDLVFRLPAATAQ